MKKIQVKVIPRAKTNEVVERNGQLVVRVTAVPTDGKANAAVLHIMAKYLGVAPSRLSIIKGGRSTQKTISCI